MLCNHGKRVAIIVFTFNEPLCCCCLLEQVQGKAPTNETQVSANNRVRKGQRLAIKSYMLLEADIFSAQFFLGLDFFGKLNNLPAHGHFSTEAVFRASVATQAAMEANFAHKKTDTKGWEKGSTFLFVRARLGYLKFLIRQVDKLVSPVTHLVGLCKLTHQTHHVAEQESAAVMY